nr:MAG: ATP synthase I chain [Candidatus Kentron sp. LFY]VFK18529.1 MAG: ATP synthase I chain [Candidatus Kentron sp. LFY]
MAYGGGMAISSTWMLIMRIRLAQKIAEDMPGREIGVLYIGVAQRFVLMLVLFIVGMAILKLDPVSLLTGFAVLQGGKILGIYLYGRHSRKRVVE